VIGANQVGATTREIDTTCVERPYPGLAVVRKKALVGMRQAHLYEPLQLTQHEATVWVRHPQC
jgi:hypothetical protein